MRIGVGENLYSALLSPVSYQFTHENFAFFGLVYLVFGAGLQRHYSDVSLRFGPSALAGSDIICTSIDRCICSLVNENAITSVSFAGFSSAIRCSHIAGFFDYFN